MKKLFPIFALTALFAFAACSDDDDNNNVVIPDTVTAFIETKYPGASVREGETTGSGLLEVDFLHDGIMKEAYFTANDEWVRTEWDVAVSLLPQAVKEAVASAYPDYIIDEADYEEYPSVVCYELDIEKGNFEQLIYVTPEGSILQERP